MFRATPPRPWKTLARGEGRESRPVGGGAQRGEGFGVCAPPAAIPFPRSFFCCSPRQRHIFSTLQVMRKSTEICVKIGLHISNCKSKIPETTGCFSKKYFVNVFLNSGGGEINPFSPIFFDGLILLQFQKKSSPNPAHITRKPTSEHRRTTLVTNQI